MLPLFPRALNSPFIRLTVLHETAQYFGMDEVAPICPISIILMKEIIEESYLIGSFRFSILRGMPPDGRGSLQAEKAQDFSTIPVHLRPFL